MQNYDIESYISLLSVRLGKTYTDEQRAMIKNFNKSFISFASPGTGKTSTAVAGLLTAELYYQIKGQNIYALSFTRLATGEMEVRHKEACEKIKVKQTINFSTLHSLCTSILEENYRLLGMDSLKSTANIPMETMAGLVEDVAGDFNIKLSPYKIRPLIRCVRSLNSALVFDRKHVESKMSFKETGLDYEDFSRIRYALYAYNKCTERIQVSDILLYTLELLTRHPEVGTNFRTKCHLMLIDEAQDLSLLQLRIISLLAPKAILIGDVKQRIYIFNGACPEVKEHYKLFYPDALELCLTRSFRCKNEIANYATSLIIPNREGGEDFTGTGDGGVVEIDNHFNVASLCDTIMEGFVANRNTFPKSILFLFRNNYSSIPIIDELYKRKVPVRCNKYNGAHTIPVISELCEIMSMANNPSTLSTMSALPYLIPEFRGYKSYKDIPLCRIAEKEGCSVLEVNYHFKNEELGTKAMQLIVQLREMILRAAPLSDLINTVWPHFYRVYLFEKEHIMENDSKYYLNLVNGIVRTKTYSQFVQDEVKKIEYLKDNEERRVGVRCYTSHASKGLEADIVHFIDADEGIIPSKKQLDDMIKRGCNYDAAMEIRNERSLVYVAVTRAKEELYIHYNPGAGLSSLFTSKNNYEYLDELYTARTTEFEDVAEFNRFVERGA
jgi:superfamily I DNA/RNA helicase